MERNILLKRILITSIIIFVVATIIFFITIKQSDKVNNSNNTNGYTDEKKVESNKTYVETKYDSNTINSEYRELTDSQRLAIDDLIDRVLEYVNNRDYTALYNMTSDKYKKIRFETLDDFKTYVNKYIKQETYKCLTYKVSRDICTLILSTTDKIDENAVEIRLAGYRITSEPKLFFEDINDIRETPSHFYMGDITLYMKYAIEYGTSESSYVTFTNESDKDINIEIEKYDLVSIIAGSQKKYGLLKNENILVPANSSKNVELFLSQKTGSIKPVYIDYKINIDGKTYEDVYPISPVEDE